MKKPREPKPEDCCNSGCNPCIFDVYEKKLQQYKSCKETDETLTENAISQLEYTNFHVVKIIDLKNEHKLILFKKCDTDNERQVFWIPGQHFLFKYLSKDFNCTRAYTPVKVNIYKDIEKHDFGILVKRNEKGVVSKYLCELNTGDVTLWRGPYGHFKLVPNKHSRIIMIVQGTGIAPMHSIIKQVLDNEEDMTKIFLVYCSKNVNTILLREELYSFKSYWNFLYEVYLSDIDTTKPCKYQEPIIYHKFKFNNLSNLKPFTKKDMFLLCGSNTFMEHFKQSIDKENIEDVCIINF